MEGERPLTLSSVLASKTMRAYLQNQTLYTTFETEQGLEKHRHITLPFASAAGATSATTDKGGRTGRLSFTRSRIQIHILELVQNQKFNL